MAESGFAHSTIVAVKAGQPVELVQWIHTADGYESRLVDRPVCLDNSDTEWRLVKGDALLRYSRAEWELCLR